MAAIALPDGYVDTGRTLGAGYSATLQLTVFSAAIMPQASWPPIISMFGLLGFVAINAGDWIIRGQAFFDNGSFGGPGAGNGRTYFWLDRVTGYNSSGVPIYTYEGLETIDWTAAVGAGSTRQTTSQQYGFSDSMGSFRLGQKLARIPPGTAEFPEFMPRDYRTSYCWYGDNDTRRICSCAGFSFSQVWNLGGIGATGAWRTGTNVNSAPVSAAHSLEAITLDFGGDSNTGVTTIPGFTFGRFTGLSYNGTLLDTSGLDGTCLKGGGAGEAHYENNSLVPEGATFAPPYSLQMDLSISKFGGDDIGATLDIPDPINGGSAITPFIGTYEVRQVSWEPSPWDGFFEATINSAWAAAYDPVLPADDLWAPLRFDPPRLAADYLPVSVLLAPEVDVQRPDGLQPSSWVSSDTGLLTVSEHSATTSFEVEAAGASATRTFASDWKHRVGLFGTADPLFGFAECERTKHRAGEDIWGWSTFAFLRVKLSAPRDTALILTVNGTHLAITDTHETSDAARKAAFSATATAWTKSYALFAREGQNEVDLDLLFPAEAPRPFYPDRVDSLTLSGFQEGVYTLQEVKLIAKGPGYLKWAPGKQLQRDDYSAWGLAVDGSWVYGALPDQAFKPDETGTYGGNPRYISLLIGTGSGLVQDAQYTLTQLADILNQQEGLAVTYSTAAHDAAMMDQYGTTLGPELAQFMQPLVPYAALTPGEVYQPDCAVLCRDAQVTAGIGFRVRIGWPLFGALEALAVTPEGERVGADALINAVPAAGGATVAQGRTDLFGYVVVTPVPANGIVEYGLQADEDPLPVVDSVALRPRDLVRRGVRVNLAESGPWPLEVRTGQYHRTHARSGRIQYRRANAVLPPFVVASSPGEGLQPRMCRDYRGRVRLFYTEAPLPVGGIVQRLSDDDGVTFGEPSSVLPGGAFPSVTYDARTQAVFATLYGGGALYGWRERPAVAGSPFPLVTDTGAGFAVEEDVAHATPAPGAAARWLMAVRILNEGAISLWESTDDGASWVRRASGLTDHKHPHVLVDPGTGMVLVAGYSESTLSGVLLYPGETSFRPMHTFRDGTGAALDVADVTFGVACASESACRWVLACRIRGESQISEFWSADWSRTWTRVPQ